VPLPNDAVTPDTLPVNDALPLLVSNVCLLLPKLSLKNIFELLLLAVFPGVCNKVPRDALEYNVLVSLAPFIQPLTLKLSSNIELPSTSIPPLDTVTEPAKVAFNPLNFNPGVVAFAISLLL